MMRIVRAKDIDASRLVGCDLVKNQDIEAQVAAILEDVRARGDAALLDYTERFDGVRPETLEVAQSDMDAACRSVGEDFLRTLEMAAANIRAFHSRQVRGDFMVNEQPGVVLGQKVLPLRRVGLYVPGGTAAYPSTVLMDAIPAKIAGVREVVMATPPGRDGRVPEAVLAAARVAGVTRVLRMGGAQAVAALAFGTQSIPRVDKIVGPGNIYVATAKRQVYGLVDIDMVAGPSEILVIADQTANPVHVAADLLSQAEHDRLASAILVTPSPALAEAVQAEVERQLARLPRAEICRASIDRAGVIVLVDSLEEAVEVSNAVAPEHLEVCVDQPFAYLSRIRNAGSIFLGKYAPEALGDYFAGPNHTLPTSGTARFSSPLSVDDFVKKSSFLYYTRDALAAVGARVVDFARREGLDAHARSVSIRLQEDNA